MEINQDTISIEKNSEDNPQDAEMHLEDKLDTSLIQENVSNRKDTQNVVGQLAIVSINQHKRTDIMKGNKLKLKKVAKECNVSIRTIIEYLEEKGYQIDSNPNAKINEEQYELVFAAFHGKQKVDEIELLDDDVEKNTVQDTKGINGESDIQTIVNDNSHPQNDVEIVKPINSTIPHISNGKYIDIKVIGKIDLNSINTNIRPNKKKHKKPTQITARASSEQEDQSTSPLSKISENEKQNICVPFSSLIFKNGKIVLHYMGKEYCQNFQKEKQCNYLISRNKEILPSTEWERYEKYNILVQLESNNGRFTFNFVNFNLHSFIVEMCERARNNINSRINSTFEYPIPTTETEVESLPDIQMSSMGIDNIEFRDGFYMVWVLRNGEKDISIAPLKINDTCSYSSLRFVQKYLSDRFPQGIQIIYTEESIIKLTNPYLLSDYIRELHDNINTRGEWWEEVRNERKPSLKQCRQVTTEESNKKVSLKNGYLDSLSSLQNNQKLIPVYEINHGKQEDAFLFSIDMPYENCAIIFENISFASTATEIFIAKKEKYESCIELVFDYFTDYGIASKRESLRRGINSPGKFNAEKYFAVNHCDLEQWLSTIFKILERTPKCADIEFVSGLNIPEDSNKRTVSTEEISTQNIHNKLMRQLYDKLSKEYGTANVGTEIRVGSKRIDTVVKLANCYDIYEIKTATDPFSCVTLALGQLCQYAYLFCRDKMGKMIIVGPSETTKEVNDYLSWFRKTYSLQVHYMYLPI